MQRTHEGSIVTGPELPERTAAHSRLMAAIAGELDAGERIPCIGNPDVWDGANVELQEAAIGSRWTREQVGFCESQ